MKLEYVNIYRMTHIDNIPHVLRYGVTHKDSQNANPNFISIGDLSLIDNRSTKVVRVDNDDFLNVDAPTIVLGSLIPFYFGAKMPMLYVVQNGGNFVEKPTPATDIIYIVCPINRIIQSNRFFYFSDGHATDNLTTFYDRSKIEELPSVIDWDAVNAPFWGGQENLYTKRKKQAEFLLSEDLPPEYLFAFACYNELAKQRLMEMGIDENIILVHPNAYY